MTAERNMRNMNNAIRSRQGKKKEKRRLIYKIHYRIGLLAALIKG